MKRFVALLLVALMMLSLLAACKKDEQPAAVATTTEETIDRAAIDNERMGYERYVIDIVMQHSGLAEEDINVLSLNQDVENKTIDFFFLYNDIEYIYTVNYETGEILSFENSASVAPSADEIPTEDAE